MDAKQFINRIKSGVGDARKTYKDGMKELSQDYKNKGDKVVKKIKHTIKPLPKMKKRTLMKAKPMEKKEYGGGASPALKNLSIGLHGTKSSKK